MNTEEGNTADQELSPWQKMSPEKREAEWGSVKDTIEQIGRETAERDGLTGTDTEQYGRLYANFVRGYLDAPKEVIMQEREPDKGRFPAEQNLIDFVHRKGLDKVETEDLEGIDDPASRMSQN